MRGEEARLAHPMLDRLAERLRARPATRAATDGDPRRAAVAAIFRLGPRGEPELLFIKRADWGGDPWSGHVAFPGGRSEPQDASLEETAIRETREETGIDIARDGVLLGALDELRPRTPALPPIIVRPHVAVVASNVAPAPSAEVAQIFWVSVSALRDPAISAEVVVVIRGEERRVASYHHGDYVIWGLTERILRQLLELLGD